MVNSSLDIDILHFCFSISPRLQSGTPTLRGVIYNLLNIQTDSFLPLQVSFQFNLMFIKRFSSSDTLLFSLNILISLKFNSWKRNKKQVFGKCRVDSPQFIIWLNGQTRRTFSHSARRFCIPNLYFDEVFSVTRQK